MPHKRLWRKNKRLSFSVNSGDRKLEVLEQEGHSTRKSACHSHAALNCPSTRVYRLFICSLIH
ncbi:hypothetical protein E2C01_022165 [Portunus trituberculatus]|uniref:Uncharacterized protein n=1 Tax=Portunus trituberculatus TaxID=210409 RepID=A0A5B7E6A5_PORTR|nr:hypothetical protein [Portunus trituberculatus]